MKREVKIGLFAVVILCCTWAGIRFLSGIDVFSRNLDYYATYEDINGVGAASSVIINGVKVGSVSAVIFDPSKSEDVTLKLSVKRRYKLPVDSRAKIYSPGLMSSSAIGIEMGKSTEYLKAGDKIATSVEPGMMDSATEQLTKAVDQVTIITEKLSTTLDGVNDIIAQSGDNVNATVANLSKISSELNSMLSSQSGNIEDAIASFSALAVTLQENSGAVASTLQNLDALSSELNEAKLGENLSSTLSELNTTLSKLNRSEGSAGMMLNDKELYDNLAAFSASLDSLIVDMKANPKRYVHFSLF